MAAHIPRQGGGVAGARQLGTRGTNVSGGGAIPLHAFDLSLNFHPSDGYRVPARFENVYGPCEILGAGHWRGTRHTVWRNVTPTFVRKTLHKEGLPLEDGGIATRDFVFVEDLVAALAGKPGEVYNLASGVETSIVDLARTLNELTGNPTPSDIRRARDWDRSGMRYGSAEQSKRELGFEAKTPIREGLKQTIDWTRANEALMSHCIARHDRLLKS